METVNTAEEGGSIVSKIGGSFFAATEGGTLGGILGTKSKAGFHRMGGRKKFAHSSVRLMVVGGNTPWEKMSGFAIMAVRRNSLCCCSRESVISILLILTPRRYSCSIPDFFRMKKESSIRTKVSGSWQEACRQRSRRGFLVSKDESTHPRASRAIWSAPSSDRRMMLSDRVTVWWLGRGQHKGKEMLYQQLGALFSDMKVAVE